MRRDESGFGGSGEHRGQRVGGCFQVWQQGSAQVDAKVDGKLSGGGGGVA